jgi:hypothetical protein
LFNAGAGDLISSPIAVPEQGANASHVANRLTTDSYAEVMLDANNDGIPDVAPGDVNAPWLRILQGASGQSLAFARFNEAVNQASAETAGNWLVNDVAPTLVQLIEPNLAKLTLAAPLPGPTNSVEISATGVQDASGNGKSTFNFFNPSSGGLTNAVSVTFVLNTASGMGAPNGAGASNYFVNGGSFPLEWGFPPAKSSPLAALNATQYSRTVNFLPGSSTQLFYKYSAEMSSGGGKGTNNYEGIRLHNFTDAARVLNLSDAVASVVVTDYLGAAAAPWRNAEFTNGYAAFYNDARRGDAGVRQRTEVLFQVDLSARSLKGARVVLVGTDPLRGFNDAPIFLPAHAYDNPDLTEDVTWVTGGLTMYDDGTNGDATPNDGIYSRRWYFTLNGRLSVAESLVGGTGSTKPYFDSWTDGRSPRSFDYKFVVYRPNDPQPVLFSPSGPNLTYYLPADQTNVTMDTHVWANEDLPFPAPEAEPEMVRVITTGAVPVVEFINEPTEFQHGVEYSTDLKQEFRDYGLRGAYSNGIWMASLPGPAPNVVSYRAYAGPPPTRITTSWSPNPIPATGATVQVWFSQISRGLAGWPQVVLRSSLQTNGAIDEFNWADHPMTFLGSGQWTAMMQVAPLVSTNKARFQFGFKNTEDTVWDQNFGPWGSENYSVIVGSRASWTPERPAAGELLTVTYDATGGALAGGTNIHIHSGYNKFEGSDWTPAFENSPMTNLGGEVWTTTLQMNTNGFKTFNMLFRNNGDTVTWDNEYDPLHWVVFPGE